MTDNAAVSHPSESSFTSTSEERKGIRGRSWIKKVRSWIKGPPKESASVSMLHLAQTNLGVRLRTIDEASLKSECQRKIYSAVTEMLKTPAEASAITEGHGWDKVYERKARSHCCIAESSCDSRLARVCRTLQV